MFSTAAFAYGPPPCHVPRRTALDMAGYGATGRATLSASRVVAGDYLSVLTSSTEGLGEGERDSEIAP